MFALEDLQSLSLFSTKGVDFQEDQTFCFDAIALARCKFLLEYTAPLAALNSPKLRIIYI